MSTPRDPVLFLTLLDSSGRPDRASPPAQLPTKGKLIVGSSAERATMQVEGQGIADVHCAIGRLKTGGWALKDLGSDFGTLLNGERVETARLEAGDELLIGSRKLRVVGDEADSGDPSGPAATTAPPTTRSAKSPLKSAQAKAAPEPLPGAQEPRSTDGAPSIAGYAIEGELGRGAMGRVLRANQTSLDRPVALKLLAPKLARDASFVERFLKEARAAAQLNHPNVVTVYDVGEDRGTHFLSMEYMDGGSVETHLSTKGRFHWREALGVLRDAAAGMVYAESRGIVHRDIKPENLMRNQDGATKIADLGLAVQVEQAHVDGERGKVFGTPYFLAPELVRGATPDARTDIYSLGATAYRMISGRTPHQGSDPRAILRSVLADEPPMLSELVQGLPPSVEQLVHGMLQKEPENRTSSAGFVVRQIDDVLAGREAAAGASMPRWIPIAIAGLALAAVAAWGLAGGKDDPGPGAGQGTKDVAIPVAGSEPPEQPAPDGTSDVAEPPGEGTEQATQKDPVELASEATTEPLEGPAELAVEDLARAALDGLRSEEMTAAERSERLKQLATEFNGTDTAQLALQEAATIERGAAEERDASAALTALRSGALDGLRARVDPEDPNLRPVDALAALASFEIPVELIEDASLLTERKQLTEAVLTRSLTILQAAEEAASQAESGGFFAGTVEALRTGLERCTPDEASVAFLGSIDPKGRAEAQEKLNELKARLDGLEGRESEFAAAREQRERAMVSRTLGTGFEERLAAADLAGAAEGARAAAELIRDAKLSAAVRTTAESLEAAGRAMEALVGAWDAGSWRRKSVVDPRDEGGEFTDVVGVASPASLLLPGPGGAPEQVPLGAWIQDPGSLENLFLRRLDRNWDADEARGIVTLLSISGTLSGLEALSPALVKNGRQLKPSAISTAREAYAEARGWADEDAELLALVESQEAPMAMLVDAILAREQGNWLRASELIARLLEEERDSFLVMILSDGGRQ